MCYQRQLGAWTRMQRSLFFTNPIFLRKCHSLKPASWNSNKNTTTSNKIVHFMRHGQAVHNVAHEADKINGLKSKENEDAWLTSKGVNQCLSHRDIIATNGKMNNVDLIVMSPTRRTLQTAIYSFPHLMGQVPWLAHESLRERFNPAYPCDRRRSIDELKSYFPNIDFSLVVDSVDPLCTRYESCESEIAVANRANDFLSWLSKRREKEIIVITHGGYLFHMMNQQVLKIHGGNCKNEMSVFENCEMRSFLITM